MSSWSHSKFVRKAGKKLAQSEKPQALRPVIIEGSVLARTWWGKAWNENLESSEEYSNTIARGRSEVRSGAILDLQVNVGEVKALVQGSRPKPYAVTVSIQKLNKNIWNMAVAACEGKLTSLEELLAGKFSTTVEETFTQRKTGLFPSPKEIECSCTCPDWASMCKHIAATLYGIGARLDLDPALFFTLRGVDAIDLTKRDGSSTAEGLVQKASSKIHRTNKGVGSPSSDVVVETQPPGSDSVRMADVRKVLKTQLKMDIKLAKKEKRSKKSGAKKIAVKGTANEIVNKVVHKQFGFRKKK